MLSVDFFACKDNNYFLNGKSLTKKLAKQLKKVAIP